MSRVLYLLLVVFLVGCDNPRPVIKLGVVLPLTGEFQIYGMQGLNGARMAVEEINSAGGVLGHRLVLIVHDNRTSPAEAVRLSRELIQIDNVFALVGPVSSTARNAMLEVADQFKIPLLYGVDYEGGSYSRYLFCYSSIPDHYVKPVVPYLMETSGSSFYIFGYDYVWPHEIAQSITATVSVNGGAIAGTEFTPFGVPDYAATLQRIKASRADNLMLILPDNDGFNFLKQFHDFDFERVIKIMAFGANESYLYKMASGHLEGVVTALPFFSSISSDVVKDFVANYQQLNGMNTIPAYSSKSHYDLIYLFKNALEQGGEVDREKMIDAMAGQQLYSGADQITLRDDHHFDLPMYLAEFHQGELNIIKNLGLIIPRDQRQAALTP